MSVKNEIYKEEIDIVIVVLVYRTGDDLYPFLKTVQNTFNCTYKVIVVNSFYDYASLKKIEKTSKELKCDFIAVENKGYGYGNNRGIEYALNKYDFKYLIVSNADIEIQKFDYSILKSDHSAIYGPQIVTDSGKQQNPYWPKEYKLAERWIYEGLKNTSKYKLKLAQGINRVRREVFLIVSRLLPKSRKVFALHGSFVIYTKTVFDLIGFPYDEEMFLFGEEACVAHKLKKSNIQSYYLPQFMVSHHEDGSTKGTNINLSGHSVKSVIYYYEKYVVK